MEEWHLYVLRYVYNGNYYVGTTPKLEKRMLVHLRRTSTKKNLPKWSAENKSTEGFRYYWFNIYRNGVSQAIVEDCENALFKIDVNGVSQAIAENCENVLAKLINNTIEIKESSRETHVGNGKYIDGKENNYDIVIKSECPDNVLIDTEIEKILKTPEPFKLVKEHSIKCIEIGNVQKYQRSDCNKVWFDIASVEFLDDNKEK